MSSPENEKDRSGHPSSDEFLLQAATLQRQSEQVLSKLDLIGRWSRVGRVVSVGSSRFGLMTSPNLDFEIYVEKPAIDIGFDTIRDLAGISGVESVVYRNFMGTPDPGLYWRIDYRDIEGKLWDIDQWLVPFDHPHTGMAERFVDSMCRVLTDTTRKTILEIKSARPELGSFRGIDAYMAVIRDHVSGVEEFRDWLKKNPPVFERIETWCP